MMVRMDVITLALSALATARITRLVTTDRITEAPRNSIIRRLPRESLLAYMLLCDWCSSVYVGAAVAGAWWAWGHTAAYTAVTAALAFSYVAGFLASKESE
jgi:hypothetical protein